MKRTIQRLFARALPFMGAEFSRSAVLQTLIRQEHLTILSSVRQRTPDNPCLFGFKAYSQFDEDGIIQNIVSRIGLTNGVFVEFGCGNGLENNTHLLCLGGWRGLWVDGNPENAKFILNTIPTNQKRLIFSEKFVTLDNANEIVQSGMNALGAAEPDLISMDLDGNDAYFLEELTKKFRPKVIVAEYNGKIPFGIRLTVKYNASGWRTGDDFFGASLSEIIARLPDYRLVACGASGVNAYFVRNDIAAPFEAYPPGDLYQPARVHLTLLSVGSRPSLKFLSQMLVDNAS